MSDFATNYMPLDALGLKGWEATPAWSRSADTNGGAALVTWMRWQGQTLATAIEANHGADLFEKMAAHAAKLDARYAVHNKPRRA